MAKSSSKKLTKYVPSETIVTAETANTWYGGLHGTPEGATYEEGDPQVAGHIHDGKHQDGHAQKINLEEHVTGKLANGNIATGAINTRTVRSFEDQTNAIPEYFIEGSTKKYYLDLSELRGEQVFTWDSGVISNKIREPETDDFVFGSNELGKSSNSDYHSRFLFDKSKSAFRAGYAENNQWNVSSRGQNSVSFGKNNISSGESSVVSGGENNVASAQFSGVASGESNLVSGETSFIGGGLSNLIDSEYGAIVGGGYNVISQSKSSLVGAGGIRDDAKYIASNNIELGFSNGIFSGIGNFIYSSSYSSICSGDSNLISGRSGSYNSCFIGSGVENRIISSKESIIGAGSSNNIIASESSGVMSGKDNEISEESINSVIASGITNGIVYSSESAILSGESNHLEYSSQSTIVSGLENNLQFSKSSTIVAGGFYNGSDGNTIIESSSSGILCGAGNSIEFGSLDVILGGRSNSISSSPKSGYNIIGSGTSNEISESLNSGIFSGYQNSITSTNSFIGSGRSNDVTGQYSSILNGYNNNVSGEKSVISGGKKNKIENNYGVIGGGLSNQIVDGDGGASNYSVLSGGRNNTVKSKYASNVGGRNNFITGDYASVIGGRNNLASGKSSIAMGEYASATSYGQRSYSSGGFFDVRGTSQEVTYIFRGIMEDGSDSVNLYLDGSSEKAKIPNNVSLYLTCELLFVGSATYAIKNTAILNNDGSAINVTDTGEYHEVKPIVLEPSWDINFVTSFVDKDWYINISTAGVPSGVRRATCICRGVYINEGSGAYAPVADFDGEPISGIAPLTVNFSDLSTNNPTGWLWDFMNDGLETSTDQNPEFTYTNPGTYSVKLTSTNSAGSDNEIKIDFIEVLSPTPPIADFEVNIDKGYAPLTVHFTDKSKENPTSWSWDFQNDGTIDDTVQNPDFTYVNPGRYNVKLTASNIYGSDSVVKLDAKNAYIAVLDPNPVASFDARGRARVGEEINFENTSSGAPNLSYQWNFGDGTPINTSRNPRHTYTTAQEYTVTLIVTSSHTGTSDSESKQIIITPEFANTNNY